MPTTAGDIYVRSGTTGAFSGATSFGGDMTLTGTITATGQLTGNSSNSGKYVRMYGWI